MNLEWYQFRFKKLARRRLEFTRALLIAALFSLRTPRTSFRRLVSAFTIWVNFWSKPETVSRTLYFERMRACYRCPVFSKQFKTCGNPRSKENRDIGCWCYMPNKASISNIRCWLDEIGGHPDYGWHESP
jgi:hypothetical protein